MPIRNDVGRRAQSRPRISAPKLGEYMDVLSARRRERIVYNQAFPSAFITARYQEAFSAVRASLLSGGDVIQQLTAHAERIERMPAGTAHRANAQTCSAQAIRRFAALVDSLGFAGMEVTAPEARSMKVPIEGVTVSVMPAVLLSRTQARGPRVHGAMLVVMNKTIGLSDRSGEAVAELLRQALCGAGFEQVRPEMCLVVDVFRDRVYRAPRASKRVSGEIASACREIAMRWSMLPA